MNIIQDITDFIFVENNPEKADIIFIPGGSWPEPAERAANLWLNGFAPLILPSGKYSIKRGFFPGTQTKKEIYNGSFTTEWDFLKSVLIKNGVSEKSILCEKCASEKGTFDNAFLSKKVTDALGLTIRKAIICCKSFHARRCLMCYSWAYPNTEFIVCPVGIENTYKENWFQSSAGIERVMSELQKCGQYFKGAISVFNHTL